MSHFRLFAPLALGLLLVSSAPALSEEAPDADGASTTVSSTTTPVVFGTAHHLASRVLGEMRTLNVLLPPGYDDVANADATYPVIYLLDGAVDEDYHHVAGLVQFLTAYQLMPPSILVGIANVDRYRDFSHETSRKRYLDRVPNAGGSVKFIPFLRDEAQPYIDATLRTSGSRLLIGQSMGGLVASEIFLRHPGLFDHYFIVSPSLWWDESSMIKAADETIQKTQDRHGSLVLTLGSEGEEMQDGVDKFVAALEGHAPETLTWRYLSMPEETHATILHRAIYQSFEILYGDSHPGL